MAGNWTRRSLLAGAAAMGPSHHRAAARAPPTTSSRNITTRPPPARCTRTSSRCGTRSATETNGRVEATVYAENNKLPGGDPAALKMLISGEIQFFTLMGGIIGTVVPVAEAQQLPFAFKSATEAHKAIDGPLGAYIGRGDGGQGHALVSGRRLRQRHAPGHGRCRVPSCRRTISAGVKIRVPPGQMIFDTFQAFGAEPVTTPANLIYDAIKSGMVGAQENPLVDPRGLQDLRSRQICQHDQSQLVGLQPDGASRHLERLPDDIKAVITRNVTKFVRQQREEQGKLNASLRDDFRRARPRLQRGRSDARSAPGLPASTRSGRKNSDRNAGGCWRRRSGSSGDSSLCPRLSRASMSFFPVIARQDVYLPVFRDEPGHDEFQF